MINRTSQMHTQSPGKLLLAAFTSPLNQNGVGMAVARMEQEMRSRGWQVLIAATEPEDPSLTPPANHHALPVDFAGGRAASDLAVKQRLYEWMDAEKPSIIVIHSWIGWPLYALIPYARQRRIPVLLMGHGFGAHMMIWTAKPPFFGLARWLRSWWFVAHMPIWMHQMAGIVVLGKRPHFVRAFDLWLARLIGYRRVHMIPNAVEPMNPIGHDFREKHSLKSKLVYICVAGYSTTKDQLHILEGFVEANIPNSVMIFIGPCANQYVEQLKTASAKTTAKVLILVGLKRAEVEAAIQASDVAVLGSRSEMQPIFLLESMSEGKPWICTMVGSVDQLDGGIIYDHTNRGLAEAMIRLSDPEQRQVIGNQGKQQWMDEFLPTVVYEKWDKLLRELVTR
jgi:glycosyltransferase involved in cell wall biosynthesis